MHFEGGGAHSLKNSLTTAVFCKCQIEMNWSLFLIFSRMPVVDLNLSFDSGNSGKENATVLNFADADYDYDDYSFFSLDDTEGKINVSQTHTSRIQKRNIDG